MEVQQSLEHGIDQPEASRKVRVLYGEAGTVVGFLAQPAVVPDRSSGCSEDSECCARESLESKERRRVAAPRRRLDRVLRVLRHLVRLKQSMDGRASLRDLGPAVLEAAMASLSSGDRPDRFTNGRSKRRHDDNALASAGFGDEQTLADSDQTLADSDQTLADSDQTSGEQTREARTATRPPPIAIRPPAIATSRRASIPESTRPAVKSVGARRSSVSTPPRHAFKAPMNETRPPQPAIWRRWCAIGLPPRAIWRWRSVTPNSSKTTHWRPPARRSSFAPRSKRKRARDFRGQAAEQRAQAARDRDAAATDREQAARDRQQALADREALARALAITQIDPLTRHAPERPA